MGIIFLCGAAGLAVVSYVIKIELQNELVGAVAFIYGFFLILSASFKHGLAATPALEDGVQPEEITE